MPSTGRARCMVTPSTCWAHRLENVQTQIPGQSPGGFSTDVTRLRCLEPGRTGVAHRPLGEASTCRASRSATANTVLVGSHLRPAFRWRCRHIRSISIRERGPHVRLFPAFERTRFDTGSVPIKEASRTGKRRRVRNAACVNPTSSAMDLNRCGSHKARRKAVSTISARASMGRVSTLRLIPGRERVAASGNSVSSRRRRPEPSSTRSQPIK